MASKTRLLAAGAAAYLIGSFPTADVVARIAARRENHARVVDLREAGTKNPGALNAAKVLGTKWGLTVLAGDIVKGALACVAGRRIARGDGAYVAGIGSVAGHCAPLWSGFRGGKGVATSAGTSIVCFPAYMPFDVTLAGATAWLSKGQAGMATYISSAAFTCAAAYWYRRGKGNLWGPPATGWLPVYAAATSGMIAYKFVTAPAVSEEASNHRATEARRTVGWTVVDETEALAATSDDWSERRDGKAPSHSDSEARDGSALHGDDALSTVRRREDGGGT